MTPRHTRPSRLSRSARVLATAMGVLATVTATVTVAAGLGWVLGVGPSEGGDPAPRPAAAQSPARPTWTGGHAGRSTTVQDRAVGVLRAWDAARSSAYSRGSEQDLRRLYVDGAGGSDVSLLGDYLDRGLRVEQMQVQVLALEVLRHPPGEWRLRVTDRLSRGVAVGSSTRTVLPRDEATTRTVRLVRSGATWRVAAVRPG